MLLYKKIQDSSTLLTFAATQLNIIWERSALVNRITHSWEFIMRTRLFYFTFALLKTRPLPRVWHQDIHYNRGVDSNHNSDDSGLGSTKSEKDLQLHFDLNTND